MPHARPRIAILAPTGQGGVAAAVDALVPVLPEAVRVPLRPLPRAAWVATAGDVDAVWLHASLRRRALVRDRLLAGLIALRHRPLAVQLHGWDPRLAARLAAAPLPGVAVWGVLTEVQQDALLRWGVPQHAVHRVTNALRPEVVPDRLAPTDPPTVLFVGRFVAEKGPLRLLEALRHDEVRVRFAGAGPERAALVHAIARWGLADRVRVDGWLPPAALRRAYAEASALALPSEDEACPLAVIEALAAGVPVLATRVGDVPALVGDGGVVLEPPVDPEVLREAVLGLLRSPPPMAAARARIRAASAPERVAASGARCSGGSPEAEPAVLPGGDPVTPRGRGRGRRRARRAPSRAVRWWGRSAPAPPARRDAVEGPDRSPATTAASSGAAAASTA
ncbi:MAG: glycosyltransferase family 4 protein [Myxococcota bacterium]